MSDFFYGVFRYFADPFFAFLQGRSVNLQIDFGNFMVGLATFAVAFVSFLVAFWSKKHEERKTVASLRESWVQDLRNRLANFIAQTQKISSSATVELNTKTHPDFFVNLQAEVRMTRAYVEMKLNKNDPLHRKILFNMDNIYSGAVGLYNAQREKQDCTDLFKNINIDTQMFLAASSSVFACEWRRIKFEMNGAWFRERRFRRRCKRALEKLEQYEASLKGKQE